jgi:hypothetical protein
VSAAEPNYSIRETPEFLAKIKGFIPDIEVWDDIRAAFDSLLCRDPTYGSRVSGTPYRAIRLLIPDAILVIYYTIDDEDRCIDLIEAQVF